MKNIYIAFYYNKRSKTIHIKGGSTSLNPRLRMQMHFAQGTADQHSYPNVLDADDLVYTRQFKHFLDKEQKVINTIRFFADLVESKGYNAKLHHAPKSHGSSNPNPNVTVRWGDQSEDEMLIGYLECEYDFENSSVPMTEKDNDLFTRLDQNQDGFLTVDEFTKPELFSSFDTNQDGHVDRKEGQQGMVRLKKQKQARQKNRGGWRDWLYRLL